MKEIHLIANPTSGKGNGLNILGKIKEWASAQKDYSFIIHETENEGHATAIARNLSSSGKPVTIFVLGGDGTISEVLNGINDFNLTTIAVLPYGSGNDFYAIIDKNVEEDPCELINAYLTNGTIRKVDYLLINEKYRAINSTGIGMSAEVIRFRNKMRLFTPKTQYKIATIIRALIWKNVHIKLSIDKGEQKEMDTMWVTMNNGFRIGGGTITSKDAKIDDGLITVSGVKKFNRLTTLSALIKCKKGNIDKLKTHFQHHCKEVDVYGDKLCLEYDGNLLENLDHINIKVVPGKLNLLVKK